MTPSVGGDRARFVADFFAVEASFAAALRVDLVGVLVDVKSVASEASRDASGACSDDSDEGSCCAGGRSVCDASAVDTMLRGGVAGFCDGSDAVEGGEGAGVGEILGAVLFGVSRPFGGISLSFAGVASSMISQPP
jgi:hypothetical protein